MKQPRQNNQKTPGIPQRLSSELWDFQQLLRSRGLEFSDDQLEQMVGYLQLLLKWNQSFNLISRGDEGRIVSRHIVESIGLLVVADAALGSLVVDVGSGGGFPAIPIKILRPDLKMTLVESNGKKASFLKNVGAKLSLRDCSVLDKRIENLTRKDIPEQDLVIARAVADLPLLWNWTSKHLRSEGKLAVIKGLDQKEIDSVSEATVISTTLFPAWLNIEKSRLVISIKKK